MGRRGTKPKPTAFKVLTGNAGKRPLPKDEPTIPPPKDTDPPAGLDGAGLAEWKRLVHELVDSGVLTMADLTVFEEYCRTLTDLRLYQTKAKKAGPELAIAKGYAGQVLKLRGQLKQYLAELGLTPSSRSGVKKSSPADPKGKLSRYRRGA